MICMCHKVSVIVIIVLSLFSFVFAYSGGSGTQQNPYRIAAVSDWNDLIYCPNDWDKHFIMTADVNLQGITLLPLGNTARKFTGVLDGNSHIIRNAEINTPAGSYIGLFGYIDTGSQVRSLGAENVNITGNNYVGGLAAYNKGIISACYVTGSVSGNNDYVGGLAGLNYQGSISGSCAAAAVSGENDVGGLVGRNYHGNISDCYALASVDGGSSGSDIGGLIGGNVEGSVISNCYAAGDVTGSLYVGGLVGYNYGNTITDCYAAGAVDGNISVGGLVGFNNHNALISDCFAAGDVNGISNVGGLVGHNYYYLGIVSDSYASGKVSGGNNVGGLVGDNWYSITACYSVGSVIGDNNTGGLVGHNAGDGNTFTSFWDVQTSGCAVSAGGQGKTTADMKNVDTFLNAEWDFNKPVWKMCNAATYPKLAWQKNLAGDFVCPPGVSFEDFAYLSRYWLLTDCNSISDCNGADMNIDGTVNFIDFALFADNWLEGI